MRIPLPTLWLAAGLAAACAAPAPDAPIEAWTLAVTPAAVATADGSDESQLTASPAGAILSWIETQGETAIARFAERTAAGWSEPRTAASGTGWFRSYADMPQVLRLSNGTLVASTLPGTDLLIEAYDLALAYSTDDGATWSAPFTPHDDGTTTQHGLATLFEMPDGGLGVVWLDGRQQELDLESPEGGDMSLRFAAFDQDWTLTAEGLLDDRVCECCPTSAALTADGPIAAYRDRSEDEIRDIRVARLTGAGEGTAPVHDDGWQIFACPVNGPALAASGDHVVVAWFTAAAGTGQSYAAFSEDGGRTFGPPIRLDDASSTGRVDVTLLDDGSAVAAWLEQANGRTQFRVRRVDASGVASPSVVVAGGGEGRVAGYPRMARAGERLIFAWTETLAPGPDGSQPASRVRVAEAALP